MSKTYQETRGRIVVTEGENKTTKILPEKGIQALVDEAKKDNKPEPEVAAVQTFTFHEATSVDEILSLVPNEVEAVNIFNRGYILKQQGIVRDLLDDEGFQAVEGSYDLMKDAQEVRERKKASPEEKALKQLAALSPEQLAAVMAQFQAAQAQAS